METAAAAEIHEKFDTKQRTATDRQIEEEGKKKNMYVEFIARGKKYTEQSSTHACPHIFFGAVCVHRYSTLLFLFPSTDPPFLLRPRQEEKTLFAPPRVK